MSISVICDRHSVIDHSHQLNSYIFLITMQSLQSTHAHTHSWGQPRCKLWNSLKCVCVLDLSAQSLEIYKNQKYIKVGQKLARK